MTQPIGTEITTAMRGKRKYLLTFESDAQPMILMDVINNWNVPRFKNLISIQYIPPSHDLSEWMQEHHEQLDRLFEGAKQTGHPYQNMYELVKELLEESLDR